MSKPPPTMQPYKPIGTGYQPIGAKPAPDTSLMQDPQFLAFHQGRVAASGGEMPDQNSPALARRVKYPGGPLAGMTRADAAGASLAAWNAQGGANKPAAPAPSAAPPSTPMDSWKADNQPPLLQPSVITPQSINGATSRGGGVATFPTGTVVDQPGGAKQMVSQYGTGSSVIVPGGNQDFSKARVFDNGKPVLTSAARAAGVTGYDAQGNAIRATPAPTATAPAPAATPAPTPAAAPQAARQVIVPKTAVSPAPAAAPAPAAPMSWADQQVNEIRNATKVYDPNSPADRAAFAPRAYPAPKVPKPMVTPGQIDQARADLADARPGWQKIRDKGAALRDGQIKSVITPYKLGAAAIHGVGMGMVKSVGQGIGWLFQGDPDKAAKAQKTLKAAGQ